jgi:hypothetical protein
MFAYLAYWVRMGRLDRLATQEKLLRASKADLVAFSNKCVYTPLHNDHLVQDFIDIKVPSDRARFVLTVEMTRSLQGWIDIPVSKGTVPVPAVHYKFPEYASRTPGCYTWHPQVEPATDPPPGLAPVSVFEARDGTMVVTEFVKQETESRNASEASAEFPECDVDPYDIVINSMSGETVYRDAGFNLFSDYDNKPVKSGSRHERKVEPRFWKYGVSDDLTDLDHCHTFKHLVFLVRNRVETWNSIKKRASHIAPMWEREGAYIGYPTWGKGERSVSTWAGVKYILHPQVFECGRCFPGYWTPPPEYFDCEDTATLGRCPSYPWEGWMFANGAFPRRVTKPFAFYPHACMHWTGQELWAEKCTNVDALLESTEGLEIRDVPGDKSWSEPADYRAEVWCVGTGLGGGAIRVREERGEHAAISSWWELVSPNISGDVAYILMSNNCSGASATIVRKDISWPSTRRFGAAGREPFKGLQILTGVGVAIKGDDDG